MDILIPIGLGFIANLLVFIISKGLKKSNERSLLNSLIAFGVTLLSSFVIGSWLGMGIAVISSGMLLFAILIAIATAIKKLLFNVKINIKPSIIGCNSRRICFFFSN
ncbi:YesK family protein [Sporosarcina sp. FA9]|uniref:YesK family protein n=1 Tax=Sporosarcina sp. FA9 TaxID=3413030 RepID=UPI003F657A11